MKFGVVVHYLPQNAQSLAAGVQRGGWRLPFMEPSWDDPRAYQWAFAAKFKILTGPSDGMIRIQIADARDRMA